MKKIFLLLALLISTLSFSQIVDGIKAKAIDGIEIVNPQTTFDFAEDLSKLGGVTTENLNCVFDGLNRLQGTEGFVMVPSGYEATRLFQQIPNVSTGLDFDVARSTTATRINDKNLIVTESIDVPRIDYSSATFTETEPESINLALRSEEFDNASWAKINTTITANTTIAPDGTLTADEEVEDNTVNPHRVNSNNIISSSGTWTVSVFCKKNTRDYSFIGITDQSSGQAEARFNLNLGTTDFIGVGGSGSWTGITSIIEDVGEGWFKCSVTATQNAGTAIKAQLLVSDGTRSYLGDGTSSIHIWGAQLSETSVLTRYVQTTTAIAGIPPLYDMEGCGALLTEPSSENLVLRSEEFDNASWTKTNATVTANTAIAPDGTLTADLLTATSTSGQSQQLYTGTASTNYNVSFWIKRKTGAGQVNIRSVENINTPITITNEWQRYDSTTTSTGTTIRIGVNLSVSGDEVYIWGAQLEELDYSTSYIPTVASTVTRGADEVTDAGDSTTFNDDEGTFLVNIKANSYSGIRYITLSDGTTNNYIRIGYGDNNATLISGSITIGGATTGLTSTVVSDIQDFHKIAISYNSSKVSIWIDGVEIHNFAGNFSFAVNTLDTLDFNRPTPTDHFYGETKSIKVFKTALTDAELARLTKLNIPFLLLAFRRKKKQEFKQAA